MLARAAGCARVTKQYELVRKAEISPFARSGTSGVRWRAGLDRWIQAMVTSAAALLPAIKPA